VTIVYDLLMAGWALYGGIRHDRGLSGRAAGAGRG
jgi:hypothetical protein